MIKLNWQISKYGSTWHTQCGRARLEVTYSSDGSGYRSGYTVTIGDMARSKPGIFKDQEKAKEWAENKLRAIASEILSTLGDS